MDMPPDLPTRILVIARPALGRDIEIALRSAGHEIHRTPDPSSAQSLSARLRPRAAVVALDLPWGDAVAAAHQLAHGARAIPVLVLGDYLREDASNGFAHLPLGVDATDIRDAVAELLEVSRGSAI
jgi:DNA-binding response OmpR family regulator